MRKFSFATAEEQAKEGVVMTKEAVVRQYFIEFIENVGDFDNDKYIEEESLRVLADLFFSGLLEIKWDPENHELMLRPV